MGAVSVSEYVASLNEEQRRHVSAFIDFMSGTYPQLTNKISFSMPMWLVRKKMNEGYVAVSAAKNHFSILFSDEEFLNRLAVSLPACKKGKRCIPHGYGRRHIWSASCRPARWASSGPRRGGRCSQ